MYKYHPGSAIVNLSLGATRVMILKSKQDYVTRLDDENETEVPTKRLYQRITLPHNSVFVLGWESNKDFLHSIRADKRRLAEKSTGELAFDQQRISLTFRTIATFIDTAGRVTGQGAQKECETVLKKADETHTVETENRTYIEVGSLDNTLEQSQALLIAFGHENKTSKFDWDKHYGRGFDIVNFSFVNDAPKEVV
jgi:hypothetical protein